MAKDTLASRSDKEGGRMEWLYSSPASLVDREQYLLGKKIDRQVDPLLASEDREKQALASGPGALFTRANAVGTTADMTAKVKEDPLFLIKKKEEESRRQLMSNPVKMKQLQELLAKEKGSKQKSKKKRNRSRSPHRSKKAHKEKRRRSPSPALSPRPSQHHSPHTHRPSRPSQHHSPHTHTPSRPSQHHSPHTHRPSRPSQHHSPHTHRPSPPSLKGSTHRSRFSQDELERRRKEMMEDAESHGREREKRLRRLEQDYRQEEEECSNTHSQDFLQPLRKESVVAAGSVQERIHRSIGSVQRTHAALDGHFLRK